MNIYAKRNFLIGAILILIGILAMYSVSIFESFRVTKAWIDPSNYFYIREHSIKILLGIIASSIVWWIPWKYIRKYDIYIFGCCVAFLVLLLSPLGDNNINTLQKARLWLTIPGFTLQPSEFFKIGYIFFLAQRMERKKHIFTETQYYIGSIGMILGLCLVFAFLPDFGTILVLAIVGMLMYRYSGGKGYYLLVSVLLGLGGVMIIEPHINYIHERIQYYIDPTRDKTGHGIGRQISNALISVGAGQLTGRGYGKGLQKFGNLPEAQSDFIFAAFLEEIGFVGGCSIVLLYIALARNTLLGLKYITDDQDKLIAIGILSTLITQARINMGVNINLIPLTGLTLPFISHGGSGLIVNLCMLTCLSKILNTVTIKENTYTKKTIT